MAHYGTAPWEMWLSCIPPGMEPFTTSEPRVLSDRAGVVVRRRWLIVSGTILRGGRWPAGAGQVFMKWMRGLSGAEPGSNTSEPRVSFALCPFFQFPGRIDSSPAGPARRRLPQLVSQFTDRWRHFLYLPALQTDDLVRQHDHERGHSCRQCGRNWSHWRWQAKHIRSHLIWVIARGSRMDRRTRVRLGPFQHQP